MGAITKWVENRNAARNNGWASIGVGTACAILFTPWVGVPLAVIGAALVKFNPKKP